MAENSWNKRLLSNVKFLGNCCCLISRFPNSAQWRSQFTFVLHYGLELDLVNEMKKYVISFMNRLFHLHCYFVTFVIFFSSINFQHCHVRNIHKNAISIKDRFLKSCEKYSSKWIPKTSLAKFSEWFKILLKRRYEKKYFTKYKKKP